MPRMLGTVALYRTVGFIETRVVDPDPGVFQKLDPYPVLSLRPDPDPGQVHPDPQTW